MDEATKTLLRSLHAACRDGNHVEVKTILKDKNIKYVLNRKMGHDKKAALHIATEQRYAKCVELLLKHPDISVDVEDARKWTSLQIAANDGYGEIVELLVEYNADLWHHTENENTPCHNAAMHGHSKVVETLLKNDAKLCDVTNTHKWTPLHLACVDGHVETVKTLLRFNVNIESETYLGETPCTLAARDNCVEIIRLLRKHDANLNAPNQNAETPLHTASMAGYEDTVEYLLKHNVDVAAKTQTGMSALHFAAKNGHYKVIELFCDNAIDFKSLINDKTDRGNTLWISTMGCGLHLPEMTALHLAAIEAKPEAVKALIVCGADRDIKDANDRTPLELIQVHLHKYQTWDRECVDEVKDILEKWTVANEDDASLANTESRQHEFRYADSDYQSSCTTEDIAESVHELEGSVRSFPRSTSNSKKAHKGIHRLRKEQAKLNDLIDKSENIGSKEKGQLNNKLQEIEENIESLETILDRRDSERCIAEVHNQGLPYEFPGRKELIRRFRANFKTLQESLQAEDHMHFLFQEEVLEASEIEQIYSTSTDHQKIAKMLYILWGKKTENWIDIFLKSLEMCDTSKQLLEIFKEG